MSGLSGFHLFGAPGLVRCPVIHRILSPGPMLCLKKNIFSSKIGVFCLKKVCQIFAEKLWIIGFQEKKTPIFGRK
jgi:hypothetical protein